MKVIRALKPDATSAAELEGLALAERLARTYARWVKFYVDRNGLSLDEAHAQAKEMQGWAAEQARRSPPREISWHDLNGLAEVDLAGAQAVWGQVRAAARQELESGERAGDFIGQAATPFQRAQFLVLRESFAEGWKPQNAIEQTLIDMLAQTYSLYTYWTAIVHERAVNECEESRIRPEKGESWGLPQQCQADAIEQASRLADGYNRQFLRSLRQLRDLRRYAQQIVVMNGGQVNVAQQQVNVSERRVD